MLVHVGWILGDLGKDSERIFDNVCEEYDETYACHSGRFDINKLGIV